MVPSDTGTTPVAKAERQAVLEENGSRFASRDIWLGLAGKLDEAELEVEGLGLLLLSEINGDVRAEIMTDQSAVLLSDDKVKKINRRAYERTLLQAGVVDPASPKGARLPMFKLADMDQVMKIGGAKIGAVIDKIEELSLLGRYMPSAEGKAASNGTQTSAGD